MKNTSGALPIIYYFQHAFFYIKKKSLNDLNSRAHESQVMSQSIERADMYLQSFTERFLTSVAEVEPTPFQNSQLLTNQTNFLNSTNFILLIKVFISISSNFYGTHIIINFKLLVF